VILSRYDSCVGDFFVLVGRWSWRHAFPPALRGSFMAQPSLYFPPDLDQHFGERLTFYLGSILSKGVLVSNLLFSLSADDTTFAFFLTKGLNE